MRTESEFYPKMAWSPNFFASNSEFNFVSSGGVQSENVQSGKRKIEDVVVDHLEEDEIRPSLSKFRRSSFEIFEATEMVMKALLFP
jgi:hypothetical protein